MLAIPVVPYVADRLGRRAGVVVGCVIMICGVVMVSIGYRIALFVVGRMVLGFGLGIAQVRLAKYAREDSMTDCGCDRNAPRFLWLNLFIRSTDPRIAAFTMRCGMWEA